MLLLMFFFFQESTKLKLNIRHKRASAHGCHTKRGEATRGQPCFLTPSQPPHLLPTFPDSSFSVGFSVRRIIHNAQRVMQPFIILFQCGRFNTGSEDSAAALGNNLFFSPPPPPYHHHYPHPSLKKREERSLIRTPPLLPPGKRATCDSRDAFKDGEIKTAAMS